MVTQPGRGGVGIQRQAKTRPLLLLTFFWTDSKQLFVRPWNYWTKENEKEKRDSLPIKKGTRIQEISSNTGNSGQYAYST